jgi:transcriptional regulator with XRE-family HTH domain
MTESKDNALMAQIGCNLKQLMSERELTVERLAEASSVDPLLISQILRGDADLRVDALALLAGALGLAPEDLADGIAWVPNEDGRGGEYRRKAG